MAPEITAADASPMPGSSCLMYDNRTTPFNTATPNRAMKPTPAETLNGIPRSRSAKIPPLAAMGTLSKISVASRNEWKFR